MERIQHPVAWLFAGVLLVNIALWVGHKTYYSMDTVLINATNPSTGVRVRVIFRPRETPLWMLDFDARGQILAVVTREQPEEQWEVIIEEEGSLRNAEQEYQWVAWEGAILRLVPGDPAGRGVIDLVLKKRVK